MHIIHQSKWWQAQTGTALALQLPVKGPLYFVLAVALAFASILTAVSQVTRQTAKPIVNRSDNPMRTTIHKCEDRDWKVFNLAQTRTLLDDYGYEYDLPWTCEAISLPWLPSAKIIRLRATIQLDDYREATLLQANASSRVWYIPTYFGMVGFPRNEDNPNNLAAFNDLLRVASFRPNDEQLVDLGDLYQSILHMDIAPVTLRDQFQVSNLSTTIEHDTHGTTLTHHESSGDSFQKTPMVWEFYFTNTSKSVRLQNVTRQTLDKYKEDN
ncbi:MAG TPA: hypothetical protein VGU23_10955 [Acidobacteriaceae bacterium]|nr:hypothetical protein [Acidobacteriaceae bacterium]